MDIHAPGFWLLPTWGRAQDKLARFFAAAKATSISTPGYVVVDASDYANNFEVYDALEMPENWSLHMVQGGCLVAATEQAWKELIEDDTQWIGWLADDLIPETPNWDIRCIDALNGYNTVSTNDGMYAPRKLNGAHVVSADLLRAVGSFCCPGTKHFYLDDFWEAIAQQTGCWTCLIDVMVRHAHASWTGSHDATTDRTNSFWTVDDKAFQAWRETEMQGAVERVLSLMEESGVKMFRPDLTGMRIMIATPCGSGQYERGYVNSLLATLSAFRQFGAVVHWAELPGCSDVSLARNKLFGQFLRGTDTHMLWLDDDMKWEPIDAIKLLMANVDFAAVAGPRKVFPPSFAVNVSDDFGQPTPIRVDPSTGFLEVTGIGFAFTVISRICAERMAQSYVDLRFFGAEGREEYGVFNNMIVNNRYLSEDFAFCHRWRAINGKILVAAEISIGHIGSFMWEGSWWAALEAKMAQERAA